MPGNTPPCPHCAGPLPEDTVWLYMGKYYCSDDCVREVQKPRVRI